MSGAAVDLSVGRGQLSDRLFARVYYSSTCVLAAALAMVATLPGRTMGLGMATEPLLRDLGLSRLSYGNINLWATLIGAGFALGTGRLLDRFGARTVLTLLALALGGVVMALSRVTGAWGLFFWVTLTRGVGQSALSAASIALVGKWFVRRTGYAMAAYSILLSVGFIPALEALGSATHHYSWRIAWWYMGLLLAGGAAPLLWLLARSSPESVGLMVDDDPGNESTESHMAGDAFSTDPTSHLLQAASETPQVARAAESQQSQNAAHGGSLLHYESSQPPVSSGAGFYGKAIVPSSGGYTLSMALATPAFWALALGGLLLNAAYSGIMLFNESILAERGFRGPPTEVLEMIFVTGLASNFLTGGLASVIRQTRLMGCAMAILGASLLLLPRVHSHRQIMAYAAIMGVSAGMVTVVFFACWGKLYGRRHLGKIQGAAQGVTVLASALGPIVLAASHARSGSYAPAFYLLSLPVAALAGLCFLVREPDALREAASWEDIGVS